MRPWCAGPPLRDVPAEKMCARIYDRSHSTPPPLARRPIPKKTKPDRPPRVGRGRAGLRITTASRPVLPCAADWTPPASSLRLRTQYGGRAPDDPGTDPMVFGGTCWACACQPALKGASTLSGPRQQRRIDRSRARRHPVAAPPPRTRGRQAVLSAGSRSRAQSADPNNSVGG